MTLDTTLIQYTGPKLTHCSPLLCSRWVQSLDVRGECIGWAHSGWKTDTCVEDINYSWDGIVKKKVLRTRKEPFFDP